MNDTAVSFCSHNGERTFLDAAKKLFAEQGFLTLDPAYLSLEAWPDGKESSPVVGIKRTITSSGLAYLDMGPGGHFVGSLEAYGLQAKRQLMEHLRKHWDASHPNLVLHSSGYDSRIISSCLAELRDEGFFLGEVHFRCHDPEGPAFIELMKRQGWHPSQYSVFDGPADDPFDIGRWDRPGTSPWTQMVKSANFWRDLVPYGLESGWNLVSGIAGGEATEYPADGKAPFLPWRFCQNEPVQRWFSYLVDNPDWVGDMEALFHKVLFPYLSEGYIRTIAQLQDRFLRYEDNGCDMVRAAILRQFKDSTLDIPRTYRIYDWRISEERWSEMRYRYGCSRFRAEVPGAPNAYDLIKKMQADMVGNDSNAGRLWRLASLWEKACS